MLTWLRGNTCTLMRAPVIPFTSVTSQAAAPQRYLGLLGGRCSSAVHHLAPLRSSRDVAVHEPSVSDRGQPIEHPSPSIQHTGRATPAGSGLDDLLEHRWRSGSALSEAHIHQQVHPSVTSSPPTQAAQPCEALEAALSGTGSGDAWGLEQRSQASKGLEQALTSQHIQDCHAGQEPDPNYNSAAGSPRMVAAGRAALLCEVERRRLSRRARRQKADAAAAMAGAIAGVGPWASTLSLGLSQFRSCAGDGPNIHACICGIF